MPRPAPSALDQHATDEDWMRYALALAERSVGLSSPNPATGCVLVQGGEVVGEGFHAYDTLDHAEVVALKQAGGRARGATAYVTLEPCSHTGRTAPCADALLAAGVRTVVAATTDPNPMVHGQGLARLRAGGAEVRLGTLQAAARRLNDGFARYIRTSLPFVVMKTAATLDGRIGSGDGASGSPFRITGDGTWEQVQKMRHGADALLTGIGTVLADNPLLTDRSGWPRRRPLLRVVLDSHLRLPLDSRLVTTANDDLLVFFVKATQEAQQALQARGIRLERLEEEDGKPGRVPPARALRRLGELRIAGVLLEGGTRLNTAILEDDLADKLVLFYAPRFLGQDAAPMLASTSRPAAIGSYTLKRYGEDFAFETYLRDPWAGVS